MGLVPLEVLDRVLFFFCPIGEFFPLEGHFPASRHNSERINLHKR